MADEFDVEEMLEAAYRKEDSNSHSRRSGSHDHVDHKRDRNRRDRSGSRSRKERSRSRTRRDRSGSRSRKERSRSKSRRDRSGSRSRRRRSVSRNRDRRRSRERDRHHRDRDRRDRGDRDRNRHRNGRLEVIDRYERERLERRGRDRYRGKRSRSHSPARGNSPGQDLTPEERDARTIFCMQLAARIRPRDLEEFFSSVGKVREVRIITDNKTRRSKGIAYIEFVDVDSVPLGMALSGQRLLGVPIIVQPSQAEKNRAAAGSNQPARGTTGPMRLYVGSLHFNITEDMLRGIFEPFGKIIDVKLMKDHDSGKSQGYGFISFQDAEDAKKALEQLNGFELAGRPMKVGHVNERTGEGIFGPPGGGTLNPTGLDTEEMDRAGIDLGATGRLQLMAKLAEGTGFQIPEVATTALQAGMQSLQPQPLLQTPRVGQPQPVPTAAGAPPIATQCFMLSNMFNPATESNPNWDVEIRDDVIEECNKHGGVLHIYVDKGSAQGNVYVKCPTISAAAASVEGLHGRWFAGKVITAAYVPLPNYHALFPDASNTSHLIITTQQAQQIGAVPNAQGLYTAPYRL